jgi:hypothetical protein
MTTSQFKLFNDENKFQKVDKVELDYDLGADEVRQGGFTLIPEGRYLCTIAATRVFQKPDSAGSIVLGIVIDEVLPGGDGKLIGASFTEWVSLSENAAWRMAILCDAVLGRQVKAGTTALVLKVLEGKKIVVDMVNGEMPSTKRPGEMIPTHEVHKEGFHPVTIWEESKKAGAAAFGGVPAGEALKEMETGDDSPFDEPEGPVTGHEPAASAEPTKAEEAKTFDLDEM